MRSQTKTTPSRLRRPIEELGQRIASARIARQMTQELMAQRCGVSRATIAKLENGDASVSADTLFRVLMVLGKDEDIGKLLAEDRVGYELAVGRTPRPSSQSVGRSPGSSVLTGGSLPRSVDFPIPDGSPRVKSFRRVSMAELHEEYKNNLAAKVKKGARTAGGVSRTAPVAKQVPRISSISVPAAPSGVSVIRTRPVTRVKKHVSGEKK